MISKHPKRPLQLSRKTPRHPPEATATLYITQTSLSSSSVHDPSSNQQQASYSLIWRKRKPPVRNPNKSIGAHLNIMVHTGIPTGTLAPAVIVNIIPVAINMTKTRKRKTSTPILLLIHVLQTQKLKTPKPILKPL